MDSEDNNNNNNDNNNDSNEYIIKFDAEIYIYKNEPFKNPVVDSVFIKAFDNEYILIDFLNSVLKLKDDDVINRIEYLGKRIFPDDESARKKVKLSVDDEEANKKNPIVNVHCFDNKNTEYLIEIQAYNEKAFTTPGSLYSSKIFSKYFKLGENTTYSEKKKVFSINILDHEYFCVDKPDHKKCYYHFATYEEEINLKMEGIEYIFIELPRFKPEYFIKPEEERLKLWLMLFTSYNKETKEFKPSQELYEDETINFAITICKRYLACKASHSHRDYEAYIKTNQGKIEKLKEELKEKKNLLEKLEKSEMLRRLQKKNKLSKQKKKFNIK